MDAVYGTNRIPEPDRAILQEPGLAVEDHVASYSSDEWFAPHYAAVPADVVVAAVEDLAPEIELVVEKLE